MERRALLTLLMCIGLSAGCQSTSPAGGDDLSSGGGQVTPDGVTQTDSYDTAGQLTGIADTTSAGPLANFSYGYDVAGQLVANTTQLDGATIASDYGYDSLSQLSSVTTTPSGGPSAVAVPSAPGPWRLWSNPAVDTLSPWDW